ncbi:unnamed protein product [Ostreobium quekettii]|uniref:Uncharacterized protein n=1 Tax=Ostreobium quekettii TaxID=121088 RepID=A0A8S1J3T5_9CHLO|nr:unnamed protein product [Ostreobium quekettii]
MFTMLNDVQTACLWNPLGSTNCGFQDVVIGMGSVELGMPAWGCREELCTGFAGNGCPLAAIEEFRFMGGDAPTQSKPFWRLGIQLSTASELISRDWAVGQGQGYGDYLCNGTCMFYRRGGADSGVLNVQALSAPRFLKSWEHGVLAQVDVQWRGNCATSTNLLCC